MFSPIQKLHEAAGWNSPSPLGEVCWWYPIISFSSWGIKWCVPVPGGYRELDVEQHASAEPWKDWMAPRFRSPPIQELCHLCYRTDLHCPKQTLCSLGILLDFQHLLKQQAIVMARRAFAQLHVVYWLLPFLDWEALLMITHVLINSCIAMHSRWRVSQSINLVQNMMM